MYPSIEQQYPSLSLSHSHSHSSKRGDTYIYPFHLTQHHTSSVRNKCGKCAKSIACEWEKKEITFSTILFLPFTTFQRLNYIPVEYIHINKQANGLVLVLVMVNEWVGGMFLRCLCWWLKKEIVKIWNVLMTYSTVKLLLNSLSYRLL